MGDGDHDQPDLGTLHQHRDSRLSFELGYDDHDPLNHGDGHRHRRTDIAQAEEGPTFLQQYDAIVAEAVAIVRERDATGRNKAVSVLDQFESTGFILGLIKMKIARAQSYLAADNYPKFVEEMEDVLNYSAFAIIKAGNS